jgi:hypothetical protein
VATLQRFLDRFRNPAGGLDVRQAAGIDLVCKVPQQVMKENPADHFAKSTAKPGLSQERRGALADRSSAVE